MGLYFIETKFTIHFSKYVFHVSFIYVELVLTFTFYSHIHTLILFVLMLFWYYFIGETKRSVIQFQLYMVQIWFVHHWNGAHRFIWHHDGWSNERQSKLLKICTCTDELLWILCYNFIKQLPSYLSRSKSIGQIFKDDEVHNRKYVLHFQLNDGWVNGMPSGSYILGKLVWYFQSKSVHSCVSRARCDIVVLTS